MLETGVRLPPPAPKKGNNMRRKKLPPGLVYPRKSKRRRGKHGPFYEEIGRVTVNPNCIDRIKVE